MHDVDKERFPRIKLQAAGLPRCPKCNSLLKRIEVKIISKKGARPEKRMIWGCLGWHTHIHCRTQFEDYYGTPDFSRELEQCV